MSEHLAVSYLQQTVAATERTTNLSEMFNAI